MHIRDIKTLQAFKKEISLLEDKEYKNSNYDFQLEKKWITGGIGGGSCWDEPGDEPHYELCEQDEPKDNTISTILKNFLPEISIEVFFKDDDEYKFWNEEFDSEYEYYGNHTEYKIKKLDLEALFQQMKNLET